MVRLQFPVAGQPEGPVLLPAVCRRSSCGRVCVLFEPSKAHQVGSPDFGRMCDSPGQNQGIGGPSVADSPSSGPPASDERLRRCPSLYND